MLLKFFQDSIIKNFYGGSTYFLDPFYHTIDKYSRYWLP